MKLNVIIFQTGRGDICMKVNNGSDNNHFVHLPISVLKDMDIYARLFSEIENFDNKAFYKAYGIS